VGDVNVYVNIPDHTWIGDLFITLTHGATTVELWDRACGNPDGLIATFDDEGSALICASPTTGTITPISAAGTALSAFDGQNANGSWTLSVDDRGSFDVGTLVSWSLIVDSQVSNVCLVNMGACCLPDGSCQILSSSACGTAGGTYRGTGTACTGLLCPRDMNCDGVINLLDVDAFVLAVLNPAGYAVQYPSCNLLRGDMNGDGLVGGDDIGLFTDAMVP
jgi:hypothetical protein